MPRKGHRMVPGPGKPLHKAGSRHERSVRHGPGAGKAGPAVRTWPPALSWRRSRTGRSSTGILSTGLPSTGRPSVRRTARKIQCQAAAGEAPWPLRTHRRDVPSGQWRPFHRPAAGHSQPAESSPWPTGRPACRACGPSLYTFWWTPCLSMEQGTGSREQKTGTRKRIASLTFFPASVIPCLRTLKRLICA